MKSKFNFVNEILDQFQENSNPKEAEKMKKYMKHHFDFYGIKSTQRKEIVLPFYKEFKSISPKEQREVISHLWKEYKRECQYTAMDFASKIEKKMDENWLSFWIEKVTEKSWWDTVDFIASHCIAHLLYDHKEQEPYTWKWTEGDDMWLQRTAIIFQLRYKSKTNVNLLFDIITSQASNKEFFIRKACGWALREYSRTNPLAVSQFINDNRDILSPLTVKEGERLIKK